MPFTFAHPAAILPFAYLPKRLVSVTGLIVGSIIPDFEYFLRFKNLTKYSHTAWGVFWFDLPLAIGCCFLFHNLVRDSLIQNLPGAVSGRVKHLCGFNWNRSFKRKWLTVLISILLGTSSHLLWDVLTHEATDRLKELSYLKNGVNGVNVHLVYYGYWGLNSLLGIVILIFAFWKLPFRRQEIILIDRNYWAQVILIDLTVVVMRFVIDRHINIFDLTDTVIVGFFIALLLVSLRKENIMAYKVKDKAVSKR